MPQIEMHIPKGALAPEAKATLVSKMTKLLLRMEGAPETPEAMSITWCFVREYAAEDFNIGGEPLQEPHYRVVLTVPEGATGIHGPALWERRDALVKKATALVLAAEGTESTPGNQGRVWIQILEIPNGYWGGYNEIADVMDVATFVGAPIVRNPTERGVRARTAFASRPKVSKRA